MSSLPDGYFDSDAAKQLRRLKRELVLALYLRCDAFWEAISDMRARWNIAPIVGLSPPTLVETVLYPAPACGLRIFMRQ